MEIIKILTTKFKSNITKLKDSIKRLWNEFEQYLEKLADQIL